MPLNLFAHPVLVLVLELELSCPSCTCTWTYLPNAHPFTCTWTYLPILIIGQIEKMPLNLLAHPLTCTWTYLPILLLVLVLELTCPSWRLCRPMSLRRLTSPSLSVNQVVSPVSRERRGIVWAGCQDNNRHGGAGKEGGKHPIPKNNVLPIRLLPAFKTTLLTLPSS